MRTLQPSPDSSAAKFERLYVKPKEGRTLIVGSQVYGDKEDRRKRYADVVGVDIQPGPGVDLILDLEHLHDIGTFDHVECMSVMEHTRRPWRMAQTLERLMNPGATIFVSVPFVHRLHGYPSDYWRMTPEGLKSIFSVIDWRHILLASERLRDGEKIKAIKMDDHPYLARTDVVGFGVKA